MDTGIRIMGFIEQIPDNPYAIWWSIMPVLVMATVVLLAAAGGTVSFQNVSQPVHRLRWAASPPIDRQ